MGLLLDSTVFIAAERRGLSARQAFIDLQSHFPGEQFALSVVSVIELAHGVARANTPQRSASRQLFLNELIIASPVHTVTVPIALRTGRLDGENTGKGIRCHSPICLLVRLRSNLVIKWPLRIFATFSSFPGCR